MSSKSAKTHDTCLDKRGVFGSTWVPARTPTVHWGLKSRKVVVARLVLGRRVCVGEGVKGKFSRGFVLGGKKSKKVLASKQKKVQRTYVTVARVTPSFSSSAE